MPPDPEAAEILFKSPAGFQLVLAAAEQIIAEAARRAAVFLNRPELKLRARSHTTSCLSLFDRDDDICMISFWPTREAAVQAPDREDPCQFFLSCEIISEKDVRHENYRTVMEVKYQPRFDRELKVGWKRHYDGVPTSGSGYLEWVKERDAPPASGSAVLDTVFRDFSAYWSR